MFTCHVSITNGTSHLKPLEHCLKIECSNQIFTYTSFHAWNHTVSAFPWSLVQKNITPMPSVRFHVWKRNKIIIWNDMDKVHASITQ